MENPQSTPSLLQRLNKWADQSIMLKMAIITVLALILLAPLFRIQDLVHERQLRKEEVVGEISNSWASHQGIAAPALVIPYTIPIANAIGKSDEVASSGMNKQYITILPEKLDMEAELETTLKSRSIFEVPLFVANVTAAGSFKIPDLVSSLGVAENQIHWDQAFLTLSISDKKGISAPPTLTWLGNLYNFESGFNHLVGSDMSLPYLGGDNSYNFFSKDHTEASGLQAKVPIAPDQREALPFSISLKLKGSEEISFIPLGKETRVNVTSAWHSPSFSGEYLPTLSNVTEDGFSATWNVSHLNRGFPQQSNDYINEHTLESTLFGVRLIDPVDGYVQTQRSVKYGILVIALAFLSFFLMEVISNRRIHPFQYVLVGVSLVVFYALLISISEHLPFGWAYFISAVATVSLISFYISSILKSAKLTFLQATGLVTIYSFIFIILRLEDYSLLAGSVGVFILVSILMMLTRKINWYRHLETQHSTK